MEEEPVVQMEPGWSRTDGSFDAVGVPIRVRLVVESGPLTARDLAYALARALSLMSGQAVRVTLGKDCEVIQP
jgi:hypothetical protein